MVTAYLRSGGLQANARLMSQGAFFRPTLSTPTGTTVRCVSLKAVKNSLKAVGNIAKITKAMKMVAAAKVKSAQVRMEVARPFAAGAIRLLEKVQSPEEFDGASNTVSVAVSSDRGLCGGINTNIAKAVRANPDDSFFMIGNKAKDQLNRDMSEYFDTSIDEHEKFPFTFSSASEVVSQMMKNDFKSGNIFYTEFKSVISFNVRELSFPSPSLLKASKDSLTEYQFEGNTDDEVLDNLSEFTTAQLIYSAVLDSATSEQASRMTAMDNATNNARDAVGRLELVYNRTRQAVITKELSEIVGGAEAL
jgi:F-type H+-transporting ATPase subunit gamma